jgi:hypothetical protein
VLKAACRPVLVESTQPARVSKSVDKGTPEGYSPWPEGYVPEPDDDDDYHPEPDEVI